MTGKSSHPFHLEVSQKLNKEQFEAVCHFNGPLVILAGAGSGKTRTMAHRIAYLIKVRNVSAENILGLSFTNKAAGELLQRVKSIGKFEKSPFLATFHRLGVRILRENGAEIGLSPKFHIIDRTDQIEIVRALLKLVKLDDRKFDPELVLFYFSTAKSRLVAEEKIPSYLAQLAAPREASSQTSLASILEATFPRYQERLRTLQSLDFDDLIYWPVQLFRKHLKIAEKYSQTFQYILVDEYQDTNAAQFELLKHLTSTHQNLCVVGDDDQSIYSWRGADPSHILSFGKHFQNAKTTILNQNYRSTGKILESANAVIHHNRNRHAKKLWSNLGEGELIQERILNSPDHEAEFVADEISRLRVEEGKNRHWRDFVVLYRANSQSQKFEEAFQLHKIPYKLVGGYSFLARKEIKDFIAYLKMLVFPNDDLAFRRVLHWPARGIGNVTFQHLNETSQKTNRSLWNSVEHAEAIKSAPMKQLLDLKTLLHATQAEWRSQPPALPREQFSALLDRYLERIHFKKSLFEEQDNALQAERRWGSVQSLIQTFLRSTFISQQPIEAVREFLSHLQLESMTEEEEDQPQDRKDEVTLLTLHGAKGLEFPIVFLVGFEEGLFPHKKGLEAVQDLSEERRLCYVGITRAQERLYLTRSKNRVRYGKETPCEPSRFLNEIPQHLRKTEDSSGVGDFVPATKKEQDEKVKNFLASIRTRLQNPNSPPSSKTP